MPTAYINDIAVAVPPHDIHEAFLDFADSMLGGEPRKARLFRRMAELSGIEHRYSCLDPGGRADAAHAAAPPFYRRGQFPDTGARMRRFEQDAPRLAEDAVRRLDYGEYRRITHLVVTCCTGFSAPGLDCELIERCALPRSVERTLIGFMGCAAAINALKLARHIVRSEPRARVLVLNLELCTLHMKETSDLEQILCFLLFGDGCAAALITAEPGGLALDSFHAMLAPDTRDFITWNIGEAGFDMTLSGQVPAAIRAALRAHAGAILEGAPAGAIDLWAVHPGGRTVLDAVESAFELAPEALAASRDVLRRYGNMSSGTVMFVMEQLMRARGGGKGCAMAFGPGLTAETMLFHRVN